MDDRDDFLRLSQIPPGVSGDVIDASGETLEPGQEAEAGCDLTPAAPREEPPSSEPPLIQASMNCAFCGTRHSVRAAQRPDARCAACRSPLHPVPPIAPSGDQRPRRAVERIDRRMPVSVSVFSPPLATLAATSEDLSIYGMRLVVPVRLQIGTCVKIECEFCDAVGEVTHVHEAIDAGPGSWRTGLQFLTLIVRQPRGSLVSINA